MIFEKIKQTLYDTCRRTMNNENTTQWSENSWDYKEKCEDRGMFGSLMFYLKYFYVQTFSFLFSYFYPLFPPLALPYHFSFLFKYIIPPYLTCYSIALYPLCGMGLCYFLKKTVVVILCESIFCFKVAFLINNGSLKRVRVKKS